MASCVAKSADAGSVHKMTLESPDICTSSLCLLESC